MTIKGHFPPVLQWRFRPVARCWFVPRFKLFLPHLPQRLSLHTRRLHRTRPRSLDCAELTGKIWQNQIELSVLSEVTKLRDFEARVWFSHHCKESKRAAAIIRAPGSDWPICSTSSVSSGWNCLFLLVWSVPELAGWTEAFQGSAPLNYWMFINSPAPSQVRFCQLKL